MLNHSNTKLAVEINSPEKELWKGEALSVSSENLSGVFDILPFHANFITIIENKPIKIRTPEKMEEFNFSNAILYATKNKIIIYTL